MVTIVIRSGKVKFKASIYMNDKKMLEMVGREKTELVNRCLWTLDFLYNYEGKINIIYRHLNESEEI